jgi:hypothetical protein
MLQPGFSDPGILRDHGILSSLMFLRVSVPPWWILSFIQ